MIYLVANFGTGRLAVGAEAGTDTLSLETGEGARFPSPTLGQGFWIRLGSASLHEIRLCVGRDGDVLTLSEPLEHGWAALTKVINPINAELVNELVQRAELGTAAFEPSNAFASPGAVSSAIASAINALGLKGAATKDVGVAGGVMSYDDSRVGGTSSAKLSALDGLSWAANKLVVLTGAATAMVLSFPNWAQTFISAVDQAAGRAALGLGNAATLNVSTGTGGVAASDDYRLVNALQPSSVQSAAFCKITMSASQNILRAGGSQLINFTVAAEGDSQFFSSSDKGHKIPAGLGGRYSCFLQVAFAAGAQSGNLTEIRAIILVNDVIKVESNFSAWVNGGWNDRCAIAFIPRIALSPSDVVTYKVSCWQTSNDNDPLDPAVYRTFAYLFN